MAKVFSERAMSDVSALLDRYEAADDGGLVRELDGEFFRNPANVLFLVEPYAKSYGVSAYDLVKAADAVYAENTEFGGEG